jgi:hypothetical protein
MIIFIKTMHTVIWVIMTTATFYIGYSVSIMRFDTVFYISFLLIVGESIVIMLNSWKCPLTNIASRYAHEDRPNFDIYLPEIIARYNKEIFSFILFIILLVFIYNSIK